MKEKLNTGKKIMMLIIAGLLSFSEASQSFAQPGFAQPADPYKTDPEGPGKIEGMQLVWNDEFNIDGQPDPGKWGNEYGFVRNRELQWYQPQNAICKNGSLLIEGKKERIANPDYHPSGRDWRTNREYAEYSSSCLLTRGLHEWPVFGYFEIRARIDTTRGSWPAIWLLGTRGRWPHCGEIDIMEFYRIDGEPTILANAAWGSEKKFRGEWDTAKVPLRKFLDSDPDWVKKFHVFSMHWDRETIQIYIDGSLINKIPLDQTVNPDGSNPFRDNNPHYILLNLALGSNGGEPDDDNFPITFEVDYVRVYQFN
ncbi:MAG TPA: glycoside hydrolase family 16 protein [Bacteroidaceae bacterium]|nr:glycoside hydrolase family 16 protein [Bacteroidaceae bacterium]